MQPKIWGPLPWKKKAVKFAKALVEYFSKLQNRGQILPKVSVILFFFFSRFPMFHTISLNWKQTENVIK